MERLTRHIYPGVICGAVIMVLCGLPGSYFPTVRTFWEWLGPDKIVHSIMFAALSFSIIIGYRKEYLEEDKSYRVKLQWITLVISILYGGLTEILQYYVFVNRYGSVYDFCADVIGCILGVFIFKIIFRKKMIKK
ncbi:MAG: VanZ family protein [Bacteroidales bacterium]|nr:VanZ family protein [Bacteroidales bacterium]